MGAKSAKAAVNAAEDAAFETRQSAARLKGRQEQLEAKWERCSWHRDPAGSSGEPSDGLNLRLHRAFSWFGRANAEYEKPDLDATFMFLWIAFNAMYGQRAPSADERRPEDHDQRRCYFVRLVDFDVRRVIDGQIKSVLKAEIETMLSNRYAYKPYWDHHNDPAKEDGNREWEPRFRDHSEKALKALEEGRTTEKTIDVLCELFHRLSTLRNQLIHGGATWKGTVNRDQVESGAKIMASLVPHFVDVMIDHPDDWGAPEYPEVQENAPQSGLLKLGGFQA